MYENGFNTTEQNAVLKEKYPDRFILNGRFDPRDGEEGSRRSRHWHERYGFKGVKLYTAEWHGDSKGWSLKDPEAKRTWRSARSSASRTSTSIRDRRSGRSTSDAFDSQTSTMPPPTFPNLNFIVEHVGLPRLEDFCCIATQEPNVYAGLAVVLGAFIHSRPRFFAQVMGELLFWLGEDKMILASDYAIWHPKWQVEMFVDWDSPRA